jgi:acetoin utilization protein AcuB
MPLFKAGLRHVSFIPAPYVFGMRFAPLFPGQETRQEKGAVMQVKYRMTLDVFTVRADTTLNEVWDLMQVLKVRHMPVVNGDHLVGIVSDRDVFLRASACAGSMVVPNVPVGEVMTKDVITCHPGNQIAQVAMTMLEHKIDCLPVVDYGRLVGLITSSDLLEILCAAASGACRQVIPVDFKLHHRPHSAQVAAGQAQGL